MKVGNYGVVYHSPSSSDQRFLQILENWFELFVDSRKFNVIAGDFNINWRDSFNSSHLKRLIEFCNLNQVVTEYTRISRHSKTLIDHVYTNFDSVRAAVNSELKITDHETLVITVNQSINSDDNLVKLKCWKNYSKRKVSDLVARNVDFPLSGCLDHKTDVLNNVLKTCTNQLVEQKFVVVKNSNKWYTLDLLRLKQNGGTMESLLLMADLKSMGIDKKGPTVLILDFINTSKACFAEDENVQESLEPDIASTTLTDNELESILEQHPRFQGIYVKKLAPKGTLQQCC
ncbi:uncharacterized protein LOC129728716 [Wyeomyia smithii]|uniref:uncharacterized protein LOC129728716 n=1 Tax=Wyeomyia smithii TaxID=174621 RepID=UPI002467F281|nr:uncharacterized protein LOC129728716 [Wyeomyia smithii]